MAEHVKAEKQRLEAERARMAVEVRLAKELLMARKAHVKEEAEQLGQEKEAWGLEVWAERV